MLSIKEPIDKYGSFFKLKRYVTRNNKINDNNRITILEI